MLSRITDLKGKLANKVNALNALMHIEQGNPSAMRRMGSLSELYVLLRDVRQSHGDARIQQRANSALANLEMNLKNSHNSLVPLIEYLAWLSQNIP